MKVHSYSHLDVFAFKSSTVLVWLGAARNLKEARSLSRRHNQTDYFYLVHSLRTGTREYFRIKEGRISYLANGVTATFMWAEQIKKTS